MKKVLIIVSILALPFIGKGNHGIDKDFSAHANLKAFLSTGDYNSKSIKSFDAFLVRLDKKHNSIKKEKDFVQYIFSKTHHKYLKSFAIAATLNNTFDNGSYNCLTGTILYSLILHHFDIQHQVIETNYHIFILAETRQGQVLIEATDPLNGFVDSPQEIEQRVNAYKQHQLQAQALLKNSYRFRINLFNTVSLNELRGLLYYNKAVSAFNQKDLRQSVKYLIQADELYTSSRLEEFSQILLLSLQQSNLEGGVKEDCMNRIISMRQEALSVIVALK